MTLSKPMEIGSIAFASTHGKVDGDGGGGKLNLILERSMGGAVLAGITGAAFRPRFLDMTSDAVGGVA